MAPLLIRLILLTTLVASVLAAISASALGSAIPNSFIVTFKPNAGSDLSAITKSISAALEHGNARESISTIRSKITSDKPVIIGSAFRSVTATLSPSALAQLRRHPAVANIWPNQLHHAIAAPAPVSRPSNQLAEQQAPVPSWGLARISSRARPGNYSRQPFTYPASAGQGVAIYIFDTGINIAHKDFNGRSEHGTATCTPRCHPTADIDGHGTHVAGTACGTKFGVAKRARCISVKALDDGGQSRTEELLKGIEWIVNRVQRRPNERAVVNMSITTGDDKALDGAILTMAYEFGVVVVVAGGNGGMSACFKSPAKIGHFGTPVITVGASDEVDALTMFSNYGPCVSILAPGTNIISAAGNSTTGSVFMTGTSMSTPHVSGAAALLLSDNPKLTPMEVKERLIDFATPDIVSDAVYETPNKLLFVGQGVV